MRKVIYCNSEKMKEALLNRDNWIKLKTSNKWCYYRHKVRKKVKLQIDLKNMIGVFWDTKKNKVISNFKRIKWKNGKKDEKRSS